MNWIMSWKGFRIRRNDAGEIGRQRKVCFGQQCGSQSVRIIPSSIAGSSSTTENYEQWARSAGISFPKISQSYFGELRGCEALDAIAPDEPFVFVPREAAIVVEPTGKCPCADFVDSNFWKQAPWFVKMGVLVLLEYSLGSKSRVSGYIQQLPESIDTPVRWTDDELTELQYQPLEDAIKAQRTTWKDQYRQFVDSYKNTAGDTWNSELASWEKFTWACENVRSRAFSGPYAGSPIVERLRLAALIAAGGMAYVTYNHVPLEQALNGAIAAAMFNLLYDIILSNKLKWYALCPIIDSINHNCKVESTIEFEYFKDRFVTSTSSAYQKGEQVFISYGNQGNDSLFQYYGFIQADNPHDTFILKGVTVAGSSIDLVFDSHGKLSSESRKSVSSLVKGQRNIDSEQDIRGATNKVVASAIKAGIKSFPTTLQEDEKALQAGHLMPVRKRAAVEFRILKKKILIKALEKIKKKIK